MSFILDALKKSESERQRQSGPALFEVKVAPPRSRVALWAALVGALLLANIVVVTWLMLRAPARTAPVPSALTAQNALPGAAPGTASLASAVPAAAAAAPTAPAGAAPRAAGPSLASAPDAPAAAATGSAPGTDSNADTHTSAVASTESADETRADDLAPAVEPSARGRSDGSGVANATTSGLPSYHDAAAVPGANLPDLRLDLHVYATRPDQRFVFLNMMKLHEGDSLPQGVRVETITPDGVILSYHGSRFVLLRS